MAPGPGGSGSTPPPATPPPTPPPSTPPGPPPAVPPIDPPEIKPIPPGPDGKPQFQDIDMDDAETKKNKNMTIAVVIGGIFFAMFMKSYMANYVGTAIANIISSIILFVMLFFVLFEQRVYREMAKRFGAGTGASDSTMLFKIAIIALGLFFRLHIMTILILLAIYFVAAKYGPVVIHKIFDTVQAIRKKKKKEEDTIASALSLAGPEGMALGAAIKMKGMVVAKLLHSLDLVVGIFIAIILSIYFGLKGFILGVIIALMFNKIIGFIVGETPITPKEVIKLISNIILVLLFSTIVFMCPYYAGQDSPLGNSCTAVGKAEIALDDALSAVPEAISQEIKRQTALASGDYYTGKVDANAEKQLGVFLQDIKQADTRFYEDLPVTLYATLQAQTLDEKIQISVNCTSTSQKKTPRVFPDPPVFTVDVFEERDIDCTYPPGGLGRGVAAVEFSASFDFKTLAYLKSYFMDQNTLRSLRRENIDPLEQYSIIDKNPVTIHTAGPVGIGMKIETPPIGIDRNSDQRVTTLGITIDNKWEGELREIQEMAIIVPIGFELIDIEGKTDFETITCEQLQETEAGCDDSLYRIYKYDPQMRKVPQGGFKTIRGHLRISQADFENVLGTAPVATHYFKISLKYKYSLIKKKAIEITPERTTGTGMAGSGGPDLTGPQITSRNVETTSSSASISWQTDEPSLDQLIYWLSTDTAKLNVWQAPQSEFNYTKEHATTIPSLTPSTRYTYQIISRDPAGNAKTSAADIFSTQAVNSTGGG